MVEIGLTFTNVTNWVACPLTLLDFYLEWYDCSDSWQASLQHYCWDGCQISKRCDYFNYKSCSKLHEILRQAVLSNSETGPRISRRNYHYGDVIMGDIASQITSFAIVYSTVYSYADQRKLQSSTSLAFVWGIHRGPVNSPHKWPVTLNVWSVDGLCYLCWWRYEIHMQTNIASKIFRT